jgi:hypothetical protein
MPGSRADIEKKIALYEKQVYLHEQTTSLFKSLFEMKKTQDKIAAFRKKIVCAKNALRAFDRGEDVVLITKHNNKVSKIYLFNKGYGRNRTYDRISRKKRYRACPIIFAC